MSDNFWLGSNQLVIVEGKGTHRVLEAFEDYESVFTGNYKSCLDYCKKRENDYMESLF